MNHIVHPTQEEVLGNNKRIIILDTIIDVLTADETVELVDKYIQTKTPLHLMGVNADKINALNKDNYLKEIVNSCGVINADGISVVAASKFLKKPLPERVAGIDLMDSLLKKKKKKGYSVYLLGAKPDVVSKAVDVIRKKYQHIKIIGFRDGYFADNEWHDISDEMNKYQPDIVFVGITSPKKEYLIEYLQGNGNSAVFMGVGGSFDVISGKIQRAPIWMQKFGLEWLYRVIQEPRRLFKRYFIGNSIFIKSVLIEKWSKKNA